MPRRVVNLYAEKAGRGRLILTRKSVREFRQVERHLLGKEPYNKENLNAGYYDAEPISIPLSIKRKRFYIQPRLDGRASIPKEAVKAGRLHSGKIPFLVSKIRRGDIFRSSGVYGYTRLKYKHKIRVFTENIISMSIDEVKLKAWQELVNAPIEYTNSNLTFSFLIISSEKDAIMRSISTKSYSLDMVKRFPKRLKRYLFDDITLIFDQADEWLGISETSGALIDTVIFLYYDISFYRVTSDAERKRWIPKSRYTVPAKRSERRNAEKKLLTKFRKFQAKQKVIGRRG